MTLDLELMREIMLVLETAPPQQIVQDIKMEGVDRPTLMEHVDLLNEEGFIDGLPLIGSRGYPEQYAVRRLTMKGHEFVRNAKNDTLWKKVTNDAKEKGGSVTMTLLNRLLEKAAEKWFGLE